MKRPAALPSRERVLGDDELCIIWRASFLIGSPFGTMVRLLMLTGQRRSEVAQMSWQELDQEQALWMIPGGRTKNGVTALVPLSREVVEELDGLALFAGASRLALRWPGAGPVLTTDRRKPVAGFSKAKKSLDVQVLAIANSEGRVMEPWRFHDLRRTLATGLQKLGHRFEVTEAVLNHKGQSRTGVAAVYQRHDWKAEKRKALEDWAGYLLGITGDREAKSTTVRPRLERSALYACD